MWSRVGIVVRALASHQCGLGSIPGPGVIYGLSLLLVLYSAPEGFLQVLQFSPLLKNQHFQIPIGCWDARTFLHEFLCSMGNQITFFFYILQNVHLNQQCLESAQKKIYQMT